MTQHHSALGLILALTLLAAGLPAWAGVNEAPPSEPSDHPLAGRIWQPDGGRWLTPDSVAERALAAGIVLLGETHDNAGHHALQAWMVRRLAAAGRRPATAFEMIDTDQQTRVDDHRADLPGLGAAVDWDSRGWPTWEQYRPIAEATLAAGGGLYAANLPRELTRRIAKGAESRDEDERFGLDTELTAAVSRAMAEEIRDGHCNMLPEAAVPAMVRVQRARDAALAEVVADQASRPEMGPVVLIAGAGHTRTDRAVPARLKQLVPGVRVFSLAFIEVEAGETDPAAYGALQGVARPPFDAVWFTPKAEREAPCAQMERHMRKKAPSPG